MDIEASNAHVHTTHARVSITSYHYARHGVHTVSYPHMGEFGERVRKHFHPRQSPSEAEWVSNE
jgi:hypothetical protein